MKKLFIAAMLLVSASSFANKSTQFASFATVRSNRQHIPASEVPAAVKATFKGLYPAATNVGWEREREHGMTV
jgi:hypothetical protein